MIEIYRDILPNYENGTHYIYSNVTNYLNMLEPYRVLELESNDYRMNNGILIISATNEAAGAYRHFTYIFESYRTATGILIRNFYHVTNVYVQSENIYITVELDIFGKFIRELNYKDLIVKRCNRKINDFMLYDEVEQTYNSTGNIDLEDTDTIQDTDMAVVFTLVYNSSQALFGNEQITCKRLCAIAMNDLLAAAHSDYDNVDAVLKAIDLLGGIHATQSTTTQELKAKVIKAWLLPKGLVPFSNVKFVNVKTKSDFTNSVDKDLNACVYFVNTSLRTYNKVIDNLEQGHTSWSSLCPYYHLTVGTRGYSKLCMRTVTPPRVIYEFSFSNNEVKAVVGFGADQQDITGAFEINMTTNNESETAMEKTATTLTKIAGGITAAAAGFKAGGVYGALAAGGLYAVSQLSNTAPLTPPLQTHGDGAFTYSIGYGHRVAFPFQINYTQACINQEEIAKLNGASCLVPMSSINDIFNYPLLFGSDIDTFVIADFKGDGIPAYAVNEIRKKFNDGIYLQKL